MLFNTPEFIFIFLPLSVLAFFQLSGRGYHQASIACLVAASLFFYGWWNPAYLGLLGVSIIFNYFIGDALNQRFVSPAKKKILLFVGISVNLALLGYYKYANFFVYTVNELFGTEFYLGKIVLPLGISFYIFQKIAYLVDAYRGETKGYKFLNYTLFVTFFPQLIAGPIVHHSEVLPQFTPHNTSRLKSEDMAVGLTIFALGLFKKVMLADRIAAYATPVFNAAAQGINPTFFEAWGAALAYSLQLYFDFSGYSDMAIGAARMFGIKLPLNFYSPYKATNIIDFWRRWHITLSRFLKDYLYIPLGGNRHGKVRRYMNLMITMLLGGLWHGANWTFVFWGGLHGIYLVINHQWHSWLRSIGKNPDKSRGIALAIGRAITFLAVVVAWVFFRSDSMSAAFGMLSGMVGINGITIPIIIASLLGPLKPLLANLGVTFPTSGGLKMVLTYFLILILLAIAWFLPNSQQWIGRYSPALDFKPEDTPASWLGKLWQKWQWRPTPRFGLIVGAIIFLFLKSLMNSSVSEFLYFNF